MDNIKSAINLITEAMVSLELNIPPNVKVNNFLLGARALLLLETTKYREGVRTFVWHKPSDELPITDLEVLISVGGSYWLGEFRSASDKWFWNYTETILKPDFWAYIPKF